MHATLDASALSQAWSENRYPSDSRFGGDDVRRIDYLPTPQEIARACASIRSGWTPSEKRRRRVGGVMPDEPNPGWSPPVIDTSIFRLSASRVETAG